jgi:voltage-gated potassium channel
MPIPNPVTRLPLLRPVPIFRGLSKGALLAVARKSSELSYQVGEVVIREGDPGDSLCIICRGAVEVRKGDRVVAKLTNGDFFGELSLIDGEPRSADVVAVDDVTLLTLTASDFDSLLSDPYFARAIIRSLAERFREVLDSLGTPPA